ATGQCDAVTPVELDVDVPQGATAFDTVQAIAILADAAQRGQVDEDTTVVLADEAFIAVAAAADRQAQRVFNSQLHGNPSGICTSCRRNLPTERRAAYSPCRPAATVFAATTGTALEHRPHSSVPDASASSGIPVGAEGHHQGTPARPPARYLYND